MPSLPCAACIGQVGVAVCRWPCPWASSAPRHPATGQRSPIPSSCLPIPWASMAAPGRGAQPALVARRVYCCYHLDTCATALSIFICRERADVCSCWWGSVDAFPSPALPRPPSVHARGLHTWCRWAVGRFRCGCGVQGLSCHSMEAAAGLGGRKCRGKGRRAGFSRGGCWAWVRLSGVLGRLVCLAGCAG